MDVNYLNQKILYLNEQRIRIHELASKYGLVNNVKIATLRLIDQDPLVTTTADGVNLKSIKDKRDRISEYHYQVNEKRKIIHKKQQVKRKE